MECLYVLGMLVQTEHCLAILDAFPLVKGHSLLIPKAPVINILDMTEETAAQVLKELPRLATAVKQATGADAVSIISNCGSAAGQVVFHSHVHVIPRFSGDGVIALGRAPPSTPIAPADASSILDKIRQHLESQ